MKIGIIGAGNIGGTLGRRWKAAGHEVVYGRRDAISVKQAVQGADVVLLAIPGNAVVELVREHKADLDGAVIVDATNDFGGPSMNVWPEMSKLVPTAKLYRAFNSYGWDVCADPELGGQQPDMFYAGPEGASQNQVEQLITDAGLRPIWVGGSDQVDTVDGVLRLWFNLSRHRGRRIAFKLIQ